MKFERYTPPQIPKLLASGLAAIALIGCNDAKTNPTAVPEGTQFLGIDQISGKKRSFLSQAFLADSGLTDIIDCGTVTSKDAGQDGELELRKRIRPHSSIHSRVDCMHEVDGFDAELINRIAQVEVEYFVPAKVD